MKRNEKNEAKNYNSSKSLKVIFKFLDSFRAYTHEFSQQPLDEG